MAFTPLLRPETERPKTAWWGSSGLHNMIRDQLTVPTWLALGALLQALLILLLGRIALLPALTYTLLTLTSTSLAASNLTPNPLMASVIPKKFSNAFPTPQGTYPSTPTPRPLAVLLIGFRNNHPLGLLAPGMKEMGTFFPQMIRDLESHRGDFGLLAATSWLSASARSTQNENMAVCYFESVEGLRAFAHSEFHAGAWRWWNKHVKEYGHLSIWHETFCVERGGWETVYVNSAVTGLAGARVGVEGKEGKGGLVWASPVVEARRGVLASMKGRMAGRDFEGEGHREGFGEDPY